jgi:hypothetical protein
LVYLSNGTPGTASLGSLSPSNQFVTVTFMWWNSPVYAAWLPINSYP